MVVRIYDFDKTLTSSDTTMMFLIYCCCFIENKTAKIVMIYFYAFCHKVRLLNNKNFKNLSYSLIFKGKSKNFIENISQAFVNENKNIFNDLGEKVSTEINRQSYIVTASPECYVKLFFKNTAVIGTRFSFDTKGIYNGIEFNCYGANKVIALTEKRVTEVDEFFTDSFSDKPLMNISKKVFLVKKNLVKEI